MRRWLFLGEQKRDLTLHRSLNIVKTNTFNKRHLLINFNRPKVSRFATDVHHTTTWHFFQLSELTQKADQKKKSINFKALFRRPKQSI